MLSEIFKAYDVRGVYGETITEEVAYKIGKAFVHFLKAKRLLSEQICASLLHHCQKHSCMAQMTWAAMLCSSDRYAQMQFILHQDT